MNRAICNTCAAHMVHIALSAKLIRKITLSSTHSRGSPLMASVFSSFSEPGPESDRLVYAVYAQAWRGICTAGGPDRQVYALPWSIEDFPSCAYLRISAPLHIPAYLGGWHCIYPPKLLHIVHIPPYRIPGPALRNRGQRWISGLQATPRQRPGLASPGKSAGSSWQVPSAPASPGRSWKLK